jgi:hypothetical protein
MPGRGGKPRTTTKTLRLSVLNCLRSSLVVSINLEDQRGKKTKSENVRQRMIQQPRTRLLRILQVPNEVDRFLVGADVPELLGCRRSQPFLFFFTPTSGGKEGRRAVEREEGE